MSTYAERMEKRRQEAEAERLRQEQEMAQPPNVLLPPSGYGESEVEKTFGGFMRNLGADIKDVAYGLTYPLHSTDEFTKSIENLMYDDQGEYTSEGVKQVAGAAVDRAKEIVSNPGDAFYERPLSTGMDVAGVVAPPLRGASAATGAAGMARTAGALRQTANAAEAFDPLSWPGTFAATANRAGTQAGVFDDSVKRTEGVVKPKLSPRHKQSDPAYRRQVITGALERGIDPTEAGMDKLRKRQAEIFDEMNAVMAKAGDREISTQKLAEGWADYANQHFDRTHPEWEKMTKAVAEQERKLKRQYQNHPENDIVSINSQGLRQARINADSKVDHNARNLESDSVQAEIDRLYSHYLREQLAGAVPELRDLNAEASALYDIYDMYNPAVMRMNNRMPVSLAATNALSNTGLAGAITGTGMDNVPLAAAGTALAAFPMIANATPTRLSMARSNFNSSNAGFGDFLTGSLLRDRNNTYGNVRKGANFIEGLFSEIMPEEEE